MDEDNQDYEIFLSQYKTAWDAKLETSKLFDKTILTLSGGAFGLSITFINQIAPSINPKTLIYLCISWGSFTASLLLTLISLLTSQYALNRHIGLLEKQYVLREEISSEKNFPSCITRWLNVFSVITFIIGAALLAFFSIKNLGRG